MTLNRVSKSIAYVGIVGSLTLTGVFGLAAYIAPILDDPKGTTKALEAHGFDPIEVGGGKWLGGDGIWRTKFKAENPKGETVEGYGISGFFKGTTLHFD